jgi:sialidase-1
VLRTVADLENQQTSVHDDFPCRLSAKVSCDRGRTWSDSFTLQENLWGRNVKHPNLIRLASGEVVLTFTAWQSEEQRNVFMKRSADDCATWSDITQISEPGWYCTNNDHILQLHSGRVILPAHGGAGFKFVPGNPLHAFVFYSDDDCRSWQVSRNTMTAPGRGAHEPSIVELAGGRLLCFLRTTQRCVYQAWSDDAGVSWSAPVPTELAAPDSPPTLAHIPGTDRLLCLWNNVASSSNWPRNPLTAAISDDQGESWTHVQDIDDRTGYDAAYPAIFFQGDEVLITYYTRKSDGARDATVLLKVFRVDQFRAP